jgi:ankyrin repeat protein
MSKDNKFRSPVTPSELLLQSLSRAGKTKELAKLLENEKFDVAVMVYVQSDFIEYFRVRSCPAEATGEVIRLLVQHGAGIRNEDITPYPIHTAANRGDIESMKALLALGEDINIRSKGPFTLGYNAVHFAAMGGEKEAIEYLRNSGADFNAITTHGLNVILIAASYNKASLIEFMAREYGSNLSWNSTRNNTPLTTAIAQEKNDILNKRPMVIALLTKYQHHIDNIAKIVNSSEDELDKIEKIGEELESAKAKDLSVKAILSSSLNPKNDTIIHQAIKKNNFRLLSFVLKKGADINAKNNDGETATKLLDELFMEQKTLSSKEKKRQLGGSLYGSMGTVDRKEIDRRTIIKSVRKQLDDIIKKDQKTGTSSAKPEASPQNPEDQKFNKDNKHTSKSTK